MAKTKSQKKDLVNRYKDLISEAKGIIIVKANKITPNEVNAFRNDVFETGSKFHVVKNNLFKIALKDSEYEVIDSLNFGEHAVLFTKEDIVSPSKGLKKLIDDTKLEDKEKTQRVTVVGGYLDGAQLTVDQAISLADMPSKEESIAMILGIIDSALGGVVNVLN
ncbi:50S ribosomal protein L10, partial [Candidatus Dojkabacteria bacterium]|nr:50S ribosomal protein L10 [Candidatus Dojkabacteria bacterium]